MSSVAFFLSGDAALLALAALGAKSYAFNHSLFKSLLFFGAGALLSATGERDMEHLGGLIHNMPRTAFAFLVGCVAISAPFRRCRRSTASFPNGSADAGRRSSSRTAISCPWLARRRWSTPPRGSSASSPISCSPQPGSPPPRSRPAAAFTVAARDKSSGSSSAGAVSVSGDRTPCSKRFAHLILEIAS
jgi:hypothetical protein